jgi:type I restriction enzyme R subunit
MRRCKKTLSSIKNYPKVINEAIAEHRAKRLSDAEYLNKIRDTMDEMRSQGSSDIPEPLKQRESAKAYYRVVLEKLPMDLVDGKIPAEIGAEVAVKVDDIIETLKKRDWTKDSSVHNQMFNEMEDYLFMIKGRYDLSWDFDVIDKIIEQSLDIAKNREL